MWAIVNKRGNLIIEKHRILWISLASSSGRYSVKLDDDTELDIDPRDFEPAESAEALAAALACIYSG